MVSARMPAVAAEVDQRALEQLARGDESALAELYDRHARLLYSLALRIVRHQADAEDVLQEVFSQVWRQASRYDASRGTVVGWLVTLTRGRAIDRLRRERVKPDQASSCPEWPIALRAIWWPRKMKMASGYTAPNSDRPSSAIGT